MNNFSIKDLAAFSGLKQHTIRIWEQRYSFLQPQRTGTAQRIYTVEELNVLLNVVLLNGEGYKISRIDKMPLEEKLKLFSEVVNQQQKAVNGLIIHMARMNAEEFEMTLDSAINFWGLHQAIQQVLLPFCSRVGLLHYESGKNFIENIIVVGHIIKQKLYAAMDKATPATDRKKKALLFDLADEAHDLPLICLQYLLKINGFTVHHLGRQIKPGQLRLIHRHTKPDYMLTHLGATGNKMGKHLAAFANDLELSGKEIITIGHPLTAGTTGSPPHRHAADIMEALALMLAV